MRPGLKAVAEEIGAVSSPEADAEDGVGTVLQQQQQLQLYVPLVRHHEADHQGLQYARKGHAPTALHEGFAKTRDARRGKLRWLLLPVVLAAPLIGVVGGQQVGGARGLSGNGARPVYDSDSLEDYFDGLIRDLQNAISREDELLRDDLEFSLLQKEEDRLDAEAVDAFLKAWPFMTAGDMAGTPRWAESWASTAFFTLGVGVALLLALATQWNKYWRDGAHSNSENNAEIQEVAQ